MAENKKSFILYIDNKPTFEELSDDEAGRLIKHIFRYVSDENPEAPDRLTKICFEQIKAQLKRDLVKYEEKRNKDSENGLLGNLKKWHLDLYNDVINNVIDINKAYSIVEERKLSPPDIKTSPPDKKDRVTSGDIAVNVNDSVNDINKKDVRAEQFEIFWSFYPKKVAKANCKKKFLSLPEKDVLQISKTIKNYVAYKPFKDYVHPNPETYLNQKRYDDELPEQNQQIGINLNLAAN